jgi:hypothetical protein
VIELLTGAEKQLSGTIPFSGTAAEFVQKLGLAPEKEYELDGILAKLSANPGKRELLFRVERNWNSDKGWVYSVR